MPIDRRFSPARIRCSPGDPRADGFSIVEMIAVIAIIVIMLGLLVPAIGSFASTAGRKAAVTTLMNTFEQARASALETGANVYVILRKRTFPERDSVLVVRDRLEWDEPGTDPWIILSRWIELPEGVLLYSQANTIVEPTPSSVPSTLDPSFEPPGLKSGDKVSYFQYNSSGAIQFPAQSPSAKLVLFVTEGVRDGSGTEARVGATDGSETAPLERLAFARYTGRARLDITQTSDIETDLDKAL